MTEAEGIYLRTGNLCTCAVTSPPCGFCESMTLAEVEALDSGGEAGLKRLWDRLESENGKTEKQKELEFFKKGHS